MDNPSYRLHEQLAYRNVDGEVVMVTPDRGLHRVASPSGVAILDALRGAPRRRDELVAAMRDHFRGEPVQIATETTTFLAQLVAIGAVVRDGDSEEPTR